MDYYVSFDFHVQIDVLDGNGEIADSLLVNLLLILLDIGKGTPLFVPIWWPDFILGPLYTTLNIAFYFSNILHIRYGIFWNMINQRLYPFINIHFSLMLCIVNRALIFCQMGLNSRFSFHLRIVNHW